MCKLLSTPFECKIIYVFGINDGKHDGMLKIGETTATMDSGKPEQYEVPNTDFLNNAAKKRIDSETKTAGIEYELLYSIRATDINYKNFSDKKVHKLLKQNGFKQAFPVKGANEWFYIDLQSAIKAIKTLINCEAVIDKSSIKNEFIPITLRDEQEAAIKMAVNTFKKKKEVLWNAKMRFGKTITALELNKRMGFSKTLIITHKPVVSASWYEDFGKVYDPKLNEVLFLSKSTTSLKINDLVDGVHKFIYFVSMQDLRESKRVGGIYEKNVDIFNTFWDFIIIDEAHEGTQTELGDRVLKELIDEKTLKLELSGTPFNIMSKYEPELIYTWDYVMEQQAKKNHEHLGTDNPYAKLPSMKMLTYDMGDMVKNGTLNQDVGFNFREFFRIDEETGRGVYEKEINDFLNMLTSTTSGVNYPFSTDEFRKNFKHTFWMLPGVKEAKLLSTLLQDHPIFKYFKVVNVAGEGDEGESNKDPLGSVKDAIENNEYTITLSCGRLTTGVTVPEWNAALMLNTSGTTEATTYLQTIFRVQSPGEIDGMIKSTAYVFDFAPDRALRMIGEATKLSVKPGERNSEDDEDTAQEFLNFFPVIATHGSEMKEFNVSDLMTALKKSYAESVARNGFDDVKLYNDKLRDLSNDELELFSRLKKSLKDSNALDVSNTTKVEVNTNKLKELDKKVKEVKKKDKKELTEEDKALLEEDKQRRKERDECIKILRAISVKMPLMIFGADINDEDEGISIDNFARLIDDESWAVFMPRVVTKEIFNIFKEFYDREIFVEAGKFIRRKTKEADLLPPEERIVEIVNIHNTFKNPDSETVLTPFKVVTQHMCDTIGGYKFDFNGNNIIAGTGKGIGHEGVTKNVYNKDTKILEINSKTGLYPLFLAYSLYAQRIKILEDNVRTPSHEEKNVIWQEILENNILVISQSPMAVMVTNRTIRGYKEDINTNVKYLDMLKFFKDKKEDELIDIISDSDWWELDNDYSEVINTIVEDEVLTVEEQKEHRRGILSRLFGK